MYYIGKNIISLCWLVIYVYTRCKRGRVTNSVISLSFHFFSFQQWSNSFHMQWTRKRYSHEKIGIRRFKYIFSKHETAKSKIFWQTSTFASSKISYGTGMNTETSPYVQKGEWKLDLPQNDMTILFFLYEHIVIYIIYSEGFNQCF